MIYLTILLVAFFETGGGYWARHWESKWWILLMALALHVSEKIGDRTHWSVALVCLSTLFSAVWSMGFHGPEVNPFTPLDPAQVYAAVAGFSFLLGATALAWSSASDLEFVRRALAFAGQANAGMILIQVAIYKPHNFFGGFIGNPSMAACFSAMTLPLWFSPLAAVLPALACIASQTSMGAGVLAAVLASQFLFKHRSMLGALVAVIIALGSAWAIRGHSFFHTSGRFNMWTLAWNFWDAQRLPMSGLGLGATPSFTPGAQKIAGMGLELFPFLHNDFLQTLIEQGWIGLTCWLVMFAFVLVRSRKTPWLMASVVGWSVTAIGNYPAHLAMPALTGAFLVAQAFHQKGGQK